MKIASVFLAVALALVGATSYTASYAERNEPILIEFNPGGGVGEFIQKYDALRRSERPVKLDGICISACTMVVGLFPAERICVTPFAKLAFHSAFFEDQFGRPHFAKEGTRLLWHVYPTYIRAILIAKGWDGEGENAEHPDLIYLEGDELLSLYRSC